MQVVIDTSVLVALLNPDDIWRTQAEAIMRTLDADEFIPINFDCAVAEAASVLARRLHEKGRGAEVPDLLKRLASQIPYHLITWILPSVPYFYREVLDMMKISSGELNLALPRFAG